MSEHIRIAIAKVLVNASNYPLGVTPYILGQDMAPLIAKVTEAAQEANLSLSQRITAALGTDDWVIVSQDGRGLVTDEELDGIEADG